VRYLALRSETRLPVAADPGTSQCHEVTFGAGTDGGLEIAGWYQVDRGAEDGLQLGLDPSQAEQAHVRRQVHEQTQDPEVVITEMRATGTVTTTGRPFTTTSVQIIRIRDGHIVHSRDFADPRILEDAIGEPGRGGENHGPFGEKSS